MAEAILLTLWVGTFLFFGCREMKARKERDSHELWLSELRDCLHGIENEFSRRCFKIIKRDQSLSSSLSQISELKKEYINEVHEKISAQKRVTVNNGIPDHVLKEYERNISDIADIYRKIKEEE